MATHDSASPTWRVAAIGECAGGAEQDFLHLGTIAERAAAAFVLAGAAVYIVLNETFADWQAIWFCAALLGLAFILARAHGAPSSE